MARAREIEGLACDTPFAEAAARTIETRTDELFSFAEGVLDTSDIERVHDMRVASRRLRAAIEIYWDALPRKERKRVLKDVKRLAGALGERRDPDVQIDALEGVAARLTPVNRAGVRSLVDTLRQRQAEGNETLSAALERVTESRLHGRLLDLAAHAREQVAGAEAA